MSWKFKRTRCIETSSGERRLGVIHKVRSTPPNAQRTLRKQRSLAARGLGAVGQLGRYQSRNRLIWPLSAIPSVVVPGLAHQFRASHIRKLQCGHYERELRWLSSKLNPRTVPTRVLSLYRSKTSCCSSEGSSLCWRQNEFLGNAGLPHSGIRVPSKRSRRRSDGCQTSTHSVITFMHTASNRCFGRREDRERPVY